MWKSHRWRFVSVSLVPATIILLSPGRKCPGMNPKRFSQRVARLPWPCPAHEGSTLTNITSLSSILGFGFFQRATGRHFLIFLFCQLCNVDRSFFLPATITRSRSFPSEKQFLYVQIVHTDWMLATKLDPVQLKKMKRRERGEAEKLGSPA